MESKYQLRVFLDETGRLGILCNGPASPSDDNGESISGINGRFHGIHNKYKFKTWRKKLRRFVIFGLSQ